MVRFNHVFSLFVNEGVGVCVCDYSFASGNIKIEKDGLTVTFIFAADIYAVRSLIRRF